MGDGGSAVGQELVGARALREWIAGEREEYSRVFLVESGAEADVLDDVVGRDDVVFLPEASRPHGASARVVHYSGRLCEVGDELFLGERGVELQDYVAAGFVQIVGPTAVSFFDHSSWQAFLDDADLARETGVFPSALIDPRVLLAGRSALAKPGAPETPSALRVSPDGRVSVGVRGETIGSVDELPTLLTVPVPRATVLGGAATPEVLAADLSRREWIGRYLDATDLMKMLRLVNGAATVSGFGWSLVDDDLADAEPRAEDPFLLETAEGFVLADTRTLRRQLLSPPTAKVVAVTQTSSTPEVAAGRVARQLGVLAADASTLCLEAATALNIRFGRRTDASCETKRTER